MANETKVAPENRDADKEAAQTAEKQNNIPELQTGMTVKIYQKIKELNIKGEEKERIQFFEGIIIAKKHGKEIGGTITVRKISNGVGVEKIFPLNLPTIEKIEIKKIADIKTSKLYYIREGFKRKLKETVVAITNKPRKK